MVACQSQRRRNDSSARREFNEKKTDSGNRCETGANELCEEGDKFYCNLKAVNLQNAAM